MGDLLAGPIVVNHLEGDQEILGQEPLVDRPHHNNMMHWRRGREYSSPLIKDIVTQNKRDPLEYVLMRHTQQRPKRTCERSGSGLSDIFDG